MKTILAIALSAAFCYSSYALAEEEYDAQAEYKEATDAINTDVQDILAFCLEEVDLGAKGQPETAEDCVHFYYRGAAARLSKAASYLAAVEGYKLGLADSDCATKSRETLTF